MVNWEEEYEKAESEFLQKNRTLFEPYVDLENSCEVVEEQLIKECSENDV